MATATLATGGLMAGVARAKWPEVARMRAAGMGPTAIAKELGVSAPTISQTLNEPEVQEEVRRINDEAIAGVVGRLGTAAFEAMDTLALIMRGDPEADPETGEMVPRVPYAVRNDAAKFVLKQAGFNPETILRLTGGAGVTIDASGLSAEQLRAILSESDEEGEDG